MWIDHLRAGEPRLIELLEAAEVITHPFVIGELACGNLKDRRNVLSLLGSLPEILTATEPEALEFIELRELMGRGIGYIDVHLLASTLLDGSVRLWSRDKKLAVTAREMGLHFNEDA